MITVAGNPSNRWLTHTFLGFFGAVVDPSGSPRRGLRNGPAPVPAQALVEVPLLLHGLVVRGPLGSDWDGDHRQDGALVVRSGSRGPYPPEPAAEPIMYYNFGRVYQTLRVTPAMEAGIADQKS